MDPAAHSFPPAAGFGSGDVPDLDVDLRANLRQWWIWIYKPLFNFFVDFFWEFEHIFLICWVLSLIWILILGSTISRAWILEHVKFIFLWSLSLLVISSNLILNTDFLFWILWFCIVWDEKKLTIILHKKEHKLLNIYCCRLELTHFSNRPLWHCSSLSQINHYEQKK